MTAFKQHIDVFIAYARKDVAYLDALRTYLKPLSRKNSINIWYDGEIAPGTVWEEQVKANLHNADIILLLVSAYSLDSDYFHDKEMADALKRHAEEKTIVIPVILSDCIWEITDLQHLQALPQNGKAIKEWDDESRAYANIVRGLLKSIEAVKQRQMEGNKALEAKEQNKRQAQIKRRKKEEEDKEQKGLKATKPPVQPDPINKELPFSIQQLIADMVPVKGGTFKMGCTKEQGDCQENEKPVHEVRLSDFSIGQYEVTQEQWQAVMGSNPSHNKNCKLCPVENVSWNDIQDFIKKLNKQTGKNFRLPTEAEWEFAARGGKESKGFKYAGGDVVDEVAWYNGNSDNKTHPVGKKKANELGLYDMSGNVWEWCADWYDGNYYAKSPADNPQGPSTGTYRVYRGGSYFSDPIHCRPAYRGYWLPDHRCNDIGFRLVLSLQSGG